MRAAAAMVALVVSSAAPFQCASEPDDPERRIEDSAPQALWELSERFRKEGDRGARRKTLHHLIDHYPKSRFARRAKHALQDGGNETAAPEGAAHAAHPDGGAAGSSAP